MPKKSSRPAIVPAVVPAVVPPEPLDPSHEIVGEFNISNVEESWNAWGKSNYDETQAIDEIIDNVIAAITKIQDALGKIHLQLDFDSGWGYLEHEGGTTFPEELALLQRTFTYGAQQQSAYNEHGCGLKTSLAILDPSNQLWKIAFAIPRDNGSCTMYSISAPYSAIMKLKRITEWPGKWRGHECRSYIKFPIRREHFRTLYTPKAKMNRDKELHDRIRNHLSHRWMLVPAFVDRKIQFTYNDMNVAPFTFRSDEVHDMVADLHQHERKLSTGGMIKMTEIKLKSDAGTLYGSDLFKFAMSSNGAYLFKNGRMIEHINGSKKEYEKLFGAKNHNSHNGHMVLIDMIGTQNQLPVTVPTKNSFKKDELYYEMLDLSSKAFKIKFEAKEHKMEDSDVAKYQEESERLYASVGFKCEFHRKHAYSLPDGHKTPPIDLVEIRNDEVLIHEFKSDTKMATQHISQLFTNWHLASTSEELKGKKITPVLTLSTSEVEWCRGFHLSYLRSFESLGFHPIIQNLKRERLHPK